MPPNKRLEKIGQAIEDHLRRILDALIPPPRPDPIPVPVIAPRRPRA